MHIRLLEDTCHGRIGRFKPRLSLFQYLGYRVFCRHADDTLPRIADHYGHPFVYIAGDYEIRKRYLNGKIPNITQSHGFFPIASFLGPNNISGVVVDMWALVNARSFFGNPVSTMSANICRWRRMRHRLCGDVTEVPDSQESCPDHIVWSENSEWGKFQDQCRDSKLRDFALTEAEAAEEEEAILRLAIGDTQRMTWRKSWLKGRRFWQNMRTAQRNRSTKALQRDSDVLGLLRH
eukprot:NODE_2983_length_834_cov_6.550318_g2475_i0.p1 GENE.NODE_2983_length_834_cov_6.550318_g2475_i0~~NODE_2983_length_834_cov_6.550318_g2475_i0.p1  ORF type:complete len:235 (-),score=34.31 NODE_2983_length_834_cov_6.550318_g2475_i0:32-736(-)